MVSSKLPAAIAASLSSDKAPLFSDRLEQQRVFEMLDDWASAPDYIELRELADPRGHLRREINRILAWVTEVELDHHMAGGSSDSAALAELDSLLAMCRYPSDLRQDLARIKELLDQAAKIARELITDELQIRARLGKSIQKFSATQSARDGRTSTRSTSNGANGKSRPSQRTPNLPTSRRWSKRGA